jgi:hypothetical protein
MLTWLTGTITDGNGSTPTADGETVIGRPASSFEASAHHNVAIWATSEGK